MAKFIDVAKEFEHRQRRTVYIVWHMETLYITFGRTYKEAFAEKEIYRKLIGCTNPQNFAIHPLELGLDYDLDIR